MEQSNIAAVPVARSFEENVKVLLNKLALDFTEGGTLEELATMIGVHPVTVYTWCKIGSVPPRKAAFIESVFGRDNVTAAQLNRHPAAN